MSHVKGASIVFIRGAMSKLDESTQNIFLTQLSEADKHNFRSILPVSWIDIDDAYAIYIKAVKYLFPDAQNGLFALGASVVKDNFKGMYQFVVKFISPVFLVNKVGKIWNLYHRKGVPQVEQVGDKHLVFHVADYPELEKILDLSSGYIYGLLEMTGVKNITVTLANNSNKNHWMWDIEWD
ncbi:hypothetical protein JW933_00935 [candidate division FCPU426 bacterium]|nr:hypothetical protein [candidate division FCPU426 bacterium]